MYYHAMYIMGRLRRRFINQIPENNRQYLSSRRAFTADGATAATILALVSGTYLSGFLSHIGVSTVMNGIISAIPALTAVFQPLGAAFAQSRGKRKPLVSIGAIVHRLMFTLMFFVPLLTRHTTAAVRAALVFALFVAANGIGAFINPAASNWIISLTPQRVRGKYFSIRELYSLITISAVTLGAGLILDRCENSVGVTAGFTAIGVIVGVLTLVNFTALSRVMEPKSAEEPAKGLGLYKTLKTVLTEKAFRPVLIMNILYNLGVQLAVPFQGIYVVGDLHVSYTAISVIGFVCSVEKAVIVRHWGRIADKTSWANVCRLAIGAIGVTHLLNFFLIPSTARWLYPVNSIIANLGWAAIGMALLNIQYDYAPLKGRTMYIGVCAAVTGVIGFSGVFIGSLALKAAEAMNLTLFGTALRGQQILMLLSGLTLTACIIYIKKRVQREQKIINKKEGMAV